MDKNSRAKAFVVRIMRECEQEGLTLAEVSIVSTLFDLEVKNRIGEIKAETVFTAT